MIYFDRFLVTRDGTCDLATGARVILKRSTRACQQLFEGSRHLTLIDWIDRGRHRLEFWERWQPVPLEPRVTATSRHVGEALTAAVHDAPRLFDVPRMTTRQYETALRLSARVARRAGWIPLGLQQLSTIVTGRRWSRVAARCLVIFVRPHDDLRAGLVALGALSARGRLPHLIVRMAEGRDRACAADRPVPGLTAVRETVACYGNAASQDALFPPAGGAETTARWSLILGELGGTRDGHLDLPRVQLARVLTERGRRFEARALLLRCRAEGGVRQATLAAMARLREVDRQEAGVALDRLLGESQKQGGCAMVDDFVGVLQLCQDVEDEHLALARVGAYLRERLQAATVAFVAPDGASLRVLARAGADPPGMEAARRSIESGCAVPAATDCGPAESATPVRHAAEVIGAVSCRWSVGTPIAGADARTLLGVAAAASAPSMRIVVERQRPKSVAAEAVPELVGESASIRVVRAAVLRAASSPFPVIVEGESGSGKELVARAIHG
ncbi:MAG: sigma 54-interacting transcriptional regulator, partial [Acidobacteria bacterium]|nr:sigma 54-interacting transcriptional regulator [Acidobacteriota bacterium]